MSSYEDSLGGGIIYFDHLLELWDKNKVDDTFRQTDLLHGQFGTGDGVTSFSFKYSPVRKLH